MSESKKSRFTIAPFRGSKNHIIVTRVPQIEVVPNELDLSKDQVRSQGNPLKHLKDFHASIKPLDRDTVVIGRGTAGKVRAVEALQRLRETGVLTIDSTPTVTHLYKRLLLHIGREEVIRIAAELDVLDELLEDQYLMRDLDADFEEPN